jgi:hypothetical protein
MSIIVRTQAPLTITFIIGIIIIMAYFFPIKEIKLISDDIVKWGVILNAFAMCLGATTLYRFHIRHVMRRTPGQWLYSIWLLIVMSIFIIRGVAWTPADPIFRWLFDITVTPIEGAMNALLAFFILSAAYRALRARTLEATFLLVAAGILMMTNAPLGEAFWGGIPVMGRWILDVPNMAASRGLIISIALGTIALSIRTLLGYEREYLGAE